MQKTWFITGASRGLGLSLAKAALAAGHKVVATGRQRKSLTQALDEDGDQLLCLPLDVSDAGQAEAAVHAATARFGGIDVLVNNAGYGHLGFFEETSAEDARVQFATNLFGVLNVTRAALPTMRTARQGRIFNVSSVGGLLGMENISLYSSSKFALEGFSECLAQEIAPFGMFVTIIEPGPFRTDFLTPESLRFGANPVADYADRRAALRASFEERNGLQPGNPEKLALAMLQLAEEAQPPLRFLAGKWAIEAADAKLAGMREEINRWRELSLGTDGF